ncbi:insulinase family protein [Geovibrio thiophilus]|uniref:Insulinase family protein n=1 Tax=Geovibrio thiophilus TaxID=139438 RepID=A0A3R5X122_9BACT|nr:pitrilysin family protein [Geovibrio thiophilus]QAR31916.1 insulinase family protein [Geovibrio thiophilus]
MKKLLAASALFLISLTASAGDTMTLENGVRFTVIERPYTETVSVSVFIKGGLFRESKTNNGVGALMSSVWVKGSNMLREMEFYGGSVGAGQGTDSFEIGFSSTAEYMDKAIELFSPFLFSPEFSGDVFEREKAIQLEEIKAIQDDPSSLSFRNFMKLSYEGTPYALTIEGEKDSVEKLTLDDVKDFYPVILQGKSTFVTVAGRITPEQVQKLKTIFAAVPAGTEFTADCAYPAQKEEIYKEDRDPRTQQAKLYVGYEAPEASSPEYAAVKVMTDIMGGGMSSRYFSEMRKNRGYAYSVGAFYPSRLCKSRFVGHIGLEYANVPEAVKAMEEINKTFLNTLTDEELTKVKNYMLGRLLIETETNSKQAWYANFFLNAGLGSGYLTKYIEDIKAVDKDALKKAAEIFNKPKTVYVLR